MFGCNKSDPAKEISEKIDQQLKRDYKKYSEVIKLLLLGTGESGKTTILKQMKILHINGFSETEKKEKIPFIKQNVHESIYSIVNSLMRIDPPLEITDEDMKKSEEFILNLGRSVEANDFTEEYYNHVKKLWRHETIQVAFSRSNEYQLIDSAKHFLDKIDDIKSEDYIPDLLDILYCRIETVSITKTEFSVDVPRKYGGGRANFWMFDVGGQRGHRRKWISVFEGVQAILFLIATSDFDQTLREDETKNRLVEAFQIFNQIFYSRYVQDAGMIVFLNKQDLLLKKIQAGKKLENYFPDYANYILPEKYGPNRDEYNKAKYFIHDQIINITKNDPTQGQYGNETEFEDRPVYLHFTIATDTKNIKLVFEDVRDLILNINTRNVVM